MKPRYKLIKVRRGPPSEKGITGWFCRIGEDYYDGIAREMRRYIPLKDGGIMILQPLTVNTTRES